MLAHDDSFIQQQKLAISVWKWLKWPLFKKKITAKELNERQTKELLLYFNNLITCTQRNRNDGCSVSYKSAEIILNGTIILCNLSFNPKSQTSPQYGAQNELRKKHQRFKLRKKNGSKRFLYIWSTTSVFNCWNKNTFLALDARDSLVLIWRMRSDSRAKTQMHCISPYQKVIIET